MAYLNRAKYTFHSRLDADPSVIADLEKALLVHPHRVECHLDVGDLFVAIGRTERALEVYRLAGEMESSARAKCGMAECLVLLGRAEEARAVAGAEMSIESRIRLAPEDARAAVEAARCGGDAYVEAVLTLLEIDPPRSAEALALVDEAMEKTRKWREEWVTRDNVTLWVPANRTHRNLLALRARAFAGLGRMDEARAELGKASALEGSNRLLLEARAYVERR
jgi:tetratricopeptide (TPR) repeat protein